ncbi:hypothetical protein LJK88_31930 [Paenibacillus sp. P26]|nr:hypothetical protein LJK88_31930 [Paenibacillus sp. P26]UUZ94193.1 hypothetical protein LJK87_06145 [Paenibacillus sp. P25]
MRNDDSDLSNLRRGKKLGEVHMLSGNACLGLDYRMKDGDATLLPEGTAIYEVVGYKPEYRLLANGELYEASGHPDAKTIGDVYDIAGKTAKVSFEGAGDGSPVSEFTAETALQFAEEYLRSPFVGFDEIYKTHPGGDPVILRIRLKDGSSFRVSYWLDANAITPGAFGTDRLRTIVTAQQKRPGQEGRSPGPPVPVR